ncbi:hypothetical protein, partial [Acidianus sp. RZ1]|uniref:hypothetical protein n=1 Tax=Acidianus sp. RZ1 TaxID=1540082 RepID=UPI001491A9C1
MKQRDKFSRVIIAARTEYLTQEILELLKSDRFNLIKVEYGDEILREIARRRLQYYLQGLINQNQIDSIADVLVEKSKGIPEYKGGEPTYHNGIPLYITEAVKYLENRIKDVGNYDEKVLDELPSGIANMIVKILEDEVKRDLRLLIEYYLVSHYPGLPKEYAIAFSVFGLKPKYIDETPHGLTLHSWYRDILDAIDQDKLDQYTNLDQYTKENFSIEVMQAKNLEDNQQYLKSHWDEIRQQLYSKGAIYALPKLKEALDNFEYYKINATLRDLSDLLFSKATTYLGKEMLKRRDSEYGFNLLKENIEYVELKPERVPFYGRLCDFLINDYFSSESLTSAISGPIRPFYYISAFYVGGFIQHEFAHEIADWFVKGFTIPDPSKMVSEMFSYYVNASFPIKRYIATVAKILEKLEYIKSSDNFSKGMLYCCEGRYDVAIKEYDIAI